MSKTGAGPDWRIADSAALALREACCGAALVASRHAERPGGRLALAEGLEARLGQRAGGRVKRGDDRALDIGDVSRPRRRADLAYVVVGAEAEGAAACTII